MVSVVVGVVQLQLISCRQCLGWGGERGEEAGGMVHCRERRAPVKTGLGEEHVGSTVSHYQTELDQVLVYNVREQ